MSTDSQPPTSIHTKLSPGYSPATPKVCRPVVITLTADSHAGHLLDMYVILPAKTTRALRRKCCEGCTTLVCCKKVSIPVLPFRLLMCSLMCRASS